MEAHKQKTAPICALGGLYKLHKDAKPNLRQKNNLL